MPAPASSDAINAALSNGVGGHLNGTSASAAREGGASTTDDAMRSASLDASATNDEMRSASLDASATDDGMRSASPDASATNGAMRSASLDARRDALEANGASRPITGEPAPASPTPRRAEREPRKRRAARSAAASASATTAAAVTASAATAAARPVTLIERLHAHQSLAAAVGRSAQGAVANLAATVDRPAAMPEPSPSSRPSDASELAGGDAIQASAIPTPETASTPAGAGEPAAPAPTEDAVTETRIARVRIEEVAAPTIVSVKVAANAEVLLDPPTSDVPILATVIEASSYMPPQLPAVTTIAPAPRPARRRLATAGLALSIGAVLTATVLLLRIDWFSPSTRADSATTPATTRTDTGSAGARNMASGVITTAPVVAADSANGKDAAAKDAAAKDAAARAVDRTRASAPAAAPVSAAATAPATTPATAFAPAAAPAAATAAPTAAAPAAPTAAPVAGVAAPDRADAPGAVPAPATTEARVEPPRMRIPVTPSTGTRTTVSGPCTDALFALGLCTRQVTAGTNEGK